MNTKLKLMLEEIINENAEQAAVHFHSYMTDVLREMATGEMSSDEDGDMDDEKKDDDCSCDDDEKSDDEDVNSDEYKEKDM